MKKIIFYFMVVFLSGHVIAGERSLLKPRPSAQTKIECIKKAYDQLQREESDENIKAYFECFPDNFDEFHQVFGYEDRGYDIYFAPLARESHIYVFLLEKAHGVVPTNQYYSKLIDMGSGGSWEGDGVNYLKMIIDKSIKKDFASFEKVLSEKSESEIQGFWLFYFDTAHGLKLDESICSGATVNGKACKVLSELVRTTVPEVDEIH